MPATKYNVISPDGFPITCEPFASEKEARDAIPAWTKRFKKQGYYSTGNRERIPLGELRHLLYMSIVPVSETDFYPVCCGNCKA